MLWWGGGTFRFFIIAHCLKDMHQFCTHEMKTKDDFL